MLAGKEIRRLGASQPTGFRQDQSPRKVFLLLAILFFLFFLVFSLISLLCLISVYLELYMRANPQAASKPRALADKPTCCSSFHLDTLCSNSKTATTSQLRVLDTYIKYVGIRCQN